MLIVRNWLRCGHQLIIQFDHTRKKVFCGKVKSHPLKTELKKTLTFRGNVKPSSACAMSIPFTIPKFKLEYWIKQKHYRMKWTSL